MRTISGSKTVRVDNLSKLTKIEDLRERLVEPFEADVGQQRLFFMAAFYWFLVHFLTRQKGQTTDLFIKYFFNYAT